MVFIHLVSCALLWFAFSLASPTGTLEGRDAGTVTAVVPAGTILGKLHRGVESFSGIPYGEAPVGPLRMKPPVRRTDSLGVFDGTGPAGACPQQIVSTDSENFLLDILGSLVNLPFVQAVTGQSEDCLTITVARPEGTAAGAKLPVLFWIYGGAFELGWTSMYDGTSLINHAKSIGQPFIFVAVQYRVSGYGFMPGKEIMSEGSGNAGLLDQRMGLEWVADNIAAFGGDADKVTIWGESAGAMSVLSQMILYDGDHTYKGKPLFRGAIMNSGSVVPTDPLDSPQGQAVFDKVVQAGGCGGAVDKLECLRGLSYTDYLNAVTSVPGVLSYNSLALSYLPRPDGKAITTSPDALILAGKYAPVPMIVGNQEDEGTLFALFQHNLTRTEDFVSYLESYYFPRASTEKLTQLVDLYGSGLSAVTNGSPFNTGLLNEIFPGFKRRAAVLGDLALTLSRRFFLAGANNVRPNVPSWSYLASYDKWTPVLGTFHGSDLLQVFYGVKDNYAARSIRTYYINFVYNLDPNVGVSGKYPNWPRWSDGNNLAQFFDHKSGLLKDDFRQAPYEWLVNNIEILRF
ncbi:sterol esterase precursor [Metarhizium album ARSEF 1941]|uniref:Carboxylic ester hydrolase n=1 Tax=Metarhizium album (strain ARSEF 1941) TaxID=1081103 RepID=A0A0B2WYT3_METAS|nr:sterol esterase precursor [Metarhizium album ARSEF 1941]KHN98015.1 sterol esterase precursor [Metarhizium album ARSEF 1941]